jgi:hypothetical protein
MKQINQTYFIHLQQEIFEPAQIKNEKNVVPLPKF